MNYNDIITIISSILSAIGTIVAILSLLKMDYKDIWKTNTMNYLKYTPIPLLIDVLHARLGISMILTALFLTIFEITNKSITKMQFLNTLIITFLILMIVITVIILIHKKNRKKIIDLQKKYNR